MNCRGHNTRVQIVNDYNIVPEAHLTLLKGQTKHSDAGAVIENDYYIFKATHKNNGNEEYILCGMDASKDFLKLTNQQPLRVFNPLKGSRNDTDNEDCGVGDKTNGSVTNGNGNKKVEHPMAKQLHNSIQWVITAMDNVKPGSTIFKINSEVEKYITYKPFVSRIKAVNTIIRKTFGGRTLTEVIDGYRKDNDLRDSRCQFDMLTEELLNEGIESCF